MNFEHSIFSLQEQATVDPLIREQFTRHLQRHEKFYKESGRVTYAMIQAFCMDEDHVFLGTASAFVDSDPNKGISIPENYAMLVSIYEDTFKTI